MSTVEVGSILHQLYAIFHGFLIFTCHETQGIDCPQIPMLVLILQRDIETVGIARFLGEVFLQQVWDLGVLRYICIDFVAVDVGQLHKVLPIAFHVQCGVLRQVVLNTYDGMVGFLQITIYRLAIVILRQVIDTRKESIKQIHHITVTGSGNKVL